MNQRSTAMERTLSQEKVTLRMVDFMAILLTLASLPPRHYAAWFAEAAVPRFLL